MAAIAKVAVIGAGVMGAGIAAQVANAGVPVLLLDILPREGGDRNAIASGAVAKMLKTEPAPFMSPAAAKLIEVGNIEDDLGKVADCDWVIEAIIERLDLKQALYLRLDAVRRPGTAVSSNTSTIPLAKLVEGMPDGFRRDFLIAHFFNPPRYMRLLEMARGPDTDPEVFAKVVDFADRQLGKTVVKVHDTPGFIGNRIGIFWMQAAMKAAREQGLTVEQADAVMGRPMGAPKTGVFGLMDLVGLDLAPHINTSMTALLPPEDPFHTVAGDFPLMQKMIAEGFTGRKGKGGFYRLNRERGKVMEAIDLNTGEYRDEVKAEVPSALSRDLRTLLSDPGELGRYGWTVLGQVLAYAASLVPEIAEDVAAVDEAMRLGFSWKQGPFELIDQLGTDWLAERLEAEGRPVPPLLAAARGRSFYRVEGGRRQVLGVDGEYHDLERPEGVLLLEDVKLRSEPVIRNGSAALWDIGEGVACFEVTTKMGALDDKVMILLQQAIGVVKERFKAMVIYTDAQNFSAGANLGLALFAANIAACGEIEKLIGLGQMMFKAMKYAPFPTVAAPAGLALGGGCEMCLNASAVQAAAETYIGLVETGVGFIPGWGGNGELMDRLRQTKGMPKGPIPVMAKAFETISMATTAKSAAHARELGYLRPTDGVTMNRDRLLADAKARALSMVDGYQPPKPPEFQLAGPSGKLALMMAAESLHKQGVASDHDIVVAGELAAVLSGGQTDIVDVVTEQQLLILEREAFLRLARTPKTLARIEHTLATGKPLRN
jgi:3-hydroxyacyl-CoA dehydrogenase